MDVTHPAACVQVAMLWPEELLKECQDAQLQADAASQAFWLEKYSREVLGHLPGSSDNPFGGQQISRQQLGE